LFKIPGGQELPENYKPRKARDAGQRGLRESMEFAGLDVRLLDRVLSAIGEELSSTPMEDLELFCADPNFKLVIINISRYFFDYLDKDPIFIFKLAAMPRLNRSLVEFLNRIADAKEVRK
jgi:hypothetical protein